MVEIFQLENSQFQWVNSIFGSNFDSSIWIWRPGYSSTFRQVLKVLLRQTRMHSCHHCFSELCLSAQITFRSNLFRFDLYKYEEYISQTFLSIQKWSGFAKNKRNLTVTTCSFFFHPDLLAYLRNIYKDSVVFVASSKPLDSKLWGQDYNRSKNSNTNPNPGHRLPTFTTRSCIWHIL